jgi:uncharacterized protein (TIGR02145 family)
LFYDNSEANALTYGFLYSYNAASSSKICPSGWRLISKEDWEKLIKIYPFDLDKTQPNIADLNAKKGWRIITYNNYNPNDGMDVPVDLSLNGKNTTSFTALPGGGYLGEYFNFNDKGNNAFFWTKNKATSQLEQIAYTGRWSISGGEMEHTLDKLDTDKESAYSIRCVCETMPPKDETVFKESKKDQIVALQDALNKENRLAWSESIKELEERAYLNILNFNLVNFIDDSLRNTYSSLNETKIKVSEFEMENKQLINSNELINQNNQKLTSELEQMKQQNLVLKQEVEQLKTKAQTPANQPATNSQVANSTANTSSSNAVVQTGNYKSVKIGTQTWMVENLNVSTFRNGDPIPEAKTNEEWEKAGKNKQPAWCYYDNDPKNGAKYGKLYNWFAVSDPRGLAPAGWHVPSDTEWTTLGNQLGNDAGKKMKSTSGWDSYGCKRCDGGSSQFKANCTSCKGTQTNSTEPFSGNGSNSSGFSGLPVGKRQTNFFGKVGEYVCWWSSTECYYDANEAFSRDMDLSLDVLYRNSRIQETGASVRCIKD